MAFYLVDYENVNTEGMQGVELLPAVDEVIIFLQPLRRSAHL